MVDVALGALAGLGDVGEGLGADAVEVLGDGVGRAWGWVEHEEGGEGGGDVEGGVWGEC